MIKLVLLCIGVVGSTIAQYAQTQFEFSPEDQSSVEHMMEEERLAVELYQLLSSKWDQPIFLAIYEEEKVHLLRTQRLAKKYKVEKRNPEYGQYANKHLQELFNRYRVLAAASETDALAAAAEFEERDIVDLQKYFSTTDNADLIIAYEYLLEGAKDHLRSIYKVMTDKGISYTPVYMHEDYFNEIVLQIPISLK